MKKITNQQIGTFKLKELATGTIFKFVKKNGSLSSTTYYIDKLDGYDRTENKYSYSNYYDISKGGLKKGDTLVSTDFIF